MHRKYGMHNSSEAPNIDKLGPGRYRAGEFVIARMGSRWRVQARHSVLNENFSTLGGAAAWCRQHGEAHNEVTNFDDEDPEEVEKTTDRIWLHSVAIARSCASPKLRTKKRTKSETIEADFFVEFEYFPWKRTKLLLTQWSPPQTDID
jgi:hypothetical protein